MSISKLVDNRTYKKKEVESCQKNSSDCMFLDTDSGSCSAEWCIFEELPKMVRTSKKLTCTVCKKNKTTVSTYSSKTQYICDECLEKINTFIKNPKCSLCGNPTVVGRCICNDCADKIKALL